jgi:hypothetical protein
MIMVEDCLAVPAPTLPLSPRLPSCIQFASITLDDSSSDQSSSGLSSDDRQIESGTASLHAGEVYFLDRPVTSAFGSTFPDPHTPPASQRGGLFTLLPERVCKGILWDKIRLPQSISLLYRLRHVSTEWRDFIAHD